MVLVTLLFIKYVFSVITVSVPRIFVLDSLDRNWLFNLLESIFRNFQIYLLIIIDEKLLDRVELYKISGSLPVLIKYVDVTALFKHQNFDTLDFIILASFVKGCLTISIYEVNRSKLPIFPIFVYLVHEFVVNSSGWRELW